MFAVFQFLGGRKVQAAGLSRFLVLSVALSICTATIEVPLAHGSDEEFFDFGHITTNFDARLQQLEEIFGDLSNSISECNANSQKTNTVASTIFDAVIDKIEKSELRIDETQSQLGDLESRMARLDERKIEIASGESIPQVEPSFQLLRSYRQPTLYMVPKEPLALRFPKKIELGFKSKHSGLLIERNDNNLILFSSEELTIAGESIIVLLADGRLYSLRVARASPGQNADTIVTLQEEQGNPSLLDSQQPRTDCVREVEF